MLVKDLDVTPTNVTVYEVTTISLSQDYVNKQVVVNYVITAVGNSILEINRVVDKRDMIITKLATTRETEISVSEQMATIFMEQLSILLGET